MQSRCPECGGPMVVTKPAPAQEEPPALAPVSEIEKDLAAEDVDHVEEVAVKAATRVCAKCGNVLATPEP